MIGEGRPWERSTNDSADRYSRLTHTGLFIRNWPLAPVESIWFAMNSGAISQPNPSIHTSAAGRLARQAASCDNFQGSTFTPGQRPSSAPGAIQCKADASSTHRRTRCPRDARSALRRQHTPRSPKLSMTRQNTSHSNGVSAVVCDVAGLTVEGMLGLSTRCVAADEKNDNSGP